MLQLNPPLVRVVVGGPGWEGPTGKGVANLIEPGHRDDDIVWIIDLDENGETWCVPNRYVRAPRNITYGRKVPGPRQAQSDFPRNGKEKHPMNGSGREEIRNPKPSCTTTGRSNFS